MRREWQQLAWIQREIAERWLRRGRETGDEFAKFFFYFSGFNALYFLWREIDRLHDANEGKQIENLLRKFDETEASKILTQLLQTVEYFSHRRPIERMDRRRGGRFEGDPREGRKWQRILVDGLTPVDRLVALGQILYLVRSNLVHGSKLDAGDDLEIIGISVPALECLLGATIALALRKASE